MTITLVKKILKDGSPCKKCNDVLERLHNSGLINKIDRITVADEGDPSSEGIELARRYQVDRAPFFIVERPGQDAQIYTVYMKFVKEVLEQSPDAKEDKAALKEIMQDNQDLDFL